MNCPINEQTADGAVVGRCWFYLKEEKICPIHGDVSIAIEYLKEEKRLMLENEFEKLKMAREDGK